MNKKTCWVVLQNSSSIYSVPVNGKVLYRNMTECFVFTAILYLYLLRFLVLGARKLWRRNVDQRYVIVHHTNLLLFKQSKLGIVFGTLFYLSPIGAYIFPMC